MVLPAVFTGVTLFISAFLLTFAVVFALLSFSGIFAHRDKQGNITEKADKRIFVMIAIVIGLVSASYEPFLDFVQNTLPLLAIGLIVLFILMFILRLFGFNPNKQREGQPQDRDFWPPIVGIVIVLLAAAVSWSYFGPYLNRYLPTWISAESVVGIVAVLIVLLLFYYADKMGRQPPT